MSRDVNILSSQFSVLMGLATLRNKGAHVEMTSNSGCVIYFKISMLYSVVELVGGFFRSVFLPKEQNATVLFVYLADHSIVWFPES